MTGTGEPGTGSDSCAAAPVSAAPPSTRASSRAWAPKRVVARGSRSASTAVDGIGVAVAMGSSGSVVVVITDEPMRETPAGSASFSDKPSVAALVGSGL